MTSSIHYAMAPTMLEFVERLSPPTIEFVVERFSPDEEKDEGKLEPNVVAAGRENPPPSPVPGMPLGC